MKTPSLSQFKTWARQNHELAQAVCAAQAFAECERQRVDAYVLPIFKSYTFIVGLTGVRRKLVEYVTSPRDLYLCTDEALCKKYYAECDQAHRAHGFKGQDGFCPALVAESELVDAQNALIKSGAELLGIDGADVHGEHRKQMLHLLLGACLKRAA